MIEISIYNEDVVDNGNLIPVYEFKSNYKVNIIGGESGTGKTRMFQCLGMALVNQDGWSVTSNKHIVLINNIINIEEQLKSTEETIFICDEDVTHMLLKRNLSKLVDNSKNYFVLIDRAMEAFIDTNVKALFEIKGTDRVFEGIEINKIVQSVNIKSITGAIDSREYEYMVIEDTASGKTFWEIMLDKLKLYGTPTGRSQVPKDLQKALEASQKKVLVAIDYDTCSAEIIKILRNDKIEKSRVSFISMESFEEVICNTEFILQTFPEMRDKVINYEKYIDASYIHTGAYFSKLLFDNVKVKSPLKHDGDRNVTKFYAKGMKNFKKCFLENCCSYGLNDCKLYTGREKKFLLLCNKFESLRQFSTVYD